MKEKKLGPAETWTRIFGFKVQGAHHYTTGPAHVKALPNAISTVGQWTWVASNHTRNQIPLWISYCGRVGGFCDEQVGLTFIYPSWSVWRHATDVYASQEATAYWVITLNVGLESCCSRPGVCICTENKKDGKRCGDMWDMKREVMHMCGGRVCVHVCGGETKTMLQWAWKCMIYRIAGLFRGRKFSWMAGICVFRE